MLGVLVSSHRDPLAWEERGLGLLMETRTGLPGHSEIQWQRVAHVSSAGIWHCCCRQNRSWGSAILLTAEHHLLSPGQDHGGEGLAQQPTASTTLAQGAHQHDTCGLSEQSHIGLQHIIMKARCEQLAVLEPLGSLKN